MNLRFSEEPSAASDDYQKLLAYRRECVKRPLPAAEDEQEIKKLNSWTWPTIPPSDKPPGAQTRDRDICCVADEQERRCSWDHIGIPINALLITAAIQNHYNLKRHSQTKQSNICVFHWRQIKYSRPGKLWGKQPEDVTTPITEEELLDMEADIEKTDNLSEPSTSEGDVSDEESMVSTLESLSLNSDSEMTSTEEEEEKEEEEDEETSTEGTSEIEGVELDDDEVEGIELAVLREQNRIRRSTSYTDEDDEEEELSSMGSSASDETPSEGEEDEEDEELEEDGAPLVNGISSSPDDTLAEDSDESDEDEEMEENGLPNGDINGSIENGVEEEEEEQEQESMDDSGESAEEDVEDDWIEESEESSEEEEEEELEEILAQANDTKVELDEGELNDNLGYDPYKYESDDSHPEIEEEDERIELIEDEREPTMRDDVDKIQNDGQNREEDEEDEETDDHGLLDFEEDEIVENPKEMVGIMQGISELSAQTLRQITGIPDLPNKAMLLEEVGRRTTTPKADLVDTVRALVREEETEDEEVMEEQVIEEEETPRGTRLRRRNN